mgnify:CR=1 FL=1
MNLNFKEKILPLKKESVFSMEDQLVWCSTVQKDDNDGLYHMIFSKWPKEKGHLAWVTDSVLGYAVADKPEGPYRYIKELMVGSGGDNWDADVIHNPTMIKFDGKYYLYYTGNKGGGEEQQGISEDADNHMPVSGDAHWWAHRNNQRIGVAVADHPAGPWKRFDKPCIDVTPGSWDHLMVSNPTVTIGPGNKVYMVYKGVGQGELPKGGAVVCGVAVADHPLGPFQKVKGPIMVNPENPWSVEDPYIWYENGMFYSIVKDFHGYFTKTGKQSTALFESKDGLDWYPSEYPLAFNCEIEWEDGTLQPVAALERPQLVFDGGKAVALLCASAFDEQRKKNVNVQFKLKQGE